MMADPWRLVVFAAAFVLTAGCGTESNVERKTTPCGAEYVDLKVGEGPGAKTGDQIYFAYTGTLADGKVFEQRDSARPATMRLGFAQPIVGLDAALEHMQAGGKRKVWVPARAGYGVRGSPPNVPANSDLIFEVELLNIIVSDDVSLMTKKEKEEQAVLNKKTKAEREIERKRETSGTDVPEADQKTITTSEGLQYVDERIGGGREALPGSNVWVLYIGKLTSGVIFDARVKREDPFSFQLGGDRVIKGWNVGVAGMKSGGKRKITIPPELAYGTTGAVGGRIPPNATLIFEIEVVRVH